MKPYSLTSSLYEKLVGRGMHLVCQHCKNYIRPSNKRDLLTGHGIPIKVVSIPSKYRQWQCIICKHKYKQGKPKDITKCNKCDSVGPARTTPSGKKKLEPIIHDFGRKFYHVSCYEETVHDVENGDNGE